jgi:hypothetical protein
MFTNNKKTVKNDFNCAFCKKIALISSSLFEANFIKRADFDFRIKIDIKNDNLAKEIL